jgi:hypothetical protein
MKRENQKNGLLIRQKEQSTTMIDNNTATMEPIKDMLKYIDVKILSKEELENDLKFYQNVIDILAKNTCDKKPQKTTEK